jgi:hypothetical protein
MCQTILSSWADDLILLKLPRSAHLSDSLLRPQFNTLEISFTGDKPLDPRADFQLNDLLY